MSDNEFDHQWNIQVDRYRSLSVADQELVYGEYKRLQAKSYDAPVLQAIIDELHRSRTVEDAVQEYEEVLMAQEAFGHDG